MGVNKVILLGNLGKDPEMRYTPQNMAIANLTIATGERKKDPSGNWVDHTEWHRVVVFGKTAENVNQYLKKGRQVYIEGRLRTRKWQDKEGKDRYTTEIVADTVQFVGGGRGDGARGHSEESAEAPMQMAANAGPVAAAPASSSGSGSAGDDVSFDDDDIPF